MPERKHTGGRMEFDYSKESKDFSTKQGQDFANAYNSWQKDRKEKKKKLSILRNIIIIFIVILILFLIVRYLL